MNSSRRSMGPECGLGAKKAAHYSAPRRAPRFFAPPRPGAPQAGTLRLAAALALLAAAGPKPEAQAKKAEAELQAVKAEIERITRQVSAEQVERDRLTRDLKSA